MYTTLISVPQLQTLIASGAPHRVFDCSFELMQAGQGDLQYSQAHIPGALRADLNRHLSATEGAQDAASGGRHPLPSRETFAAWLGGMGFDNTMQAVVYDRQGANYCGRLWWMLKWVGVESVAVLDGGLQAWQAAGGTTQASFALRPARVPLVNTATVFARLEQATQTVIDARGGPRFRGETEPLDPVAGHIPGALNRPFGQNLDEHGFFKPAAVLRAEFEALLAQQDPQSVVHHCGSGVSAVPNLIAMEIAGLHGSGLYAGSWSEWCNTPGLPCAKG
jgi:thiosulfate/3-mercaptopyruvate sulfurtransferase